jgi:excisionase family DNA binding protein
MDVPHDLISLAEAAKILHVHGRTIRRKITTGEITGYKIGQLVRVSRSELLGTVRTIPARGVA